MLDFRIDTFLAVCRLHSYTRAAAELHLTQPAVTQHIKKLEAHYGCRLIDTGGRRPVPTPQGAALWRYTALQRQSERQLIERLGRLTPPLHLGATLSIADYYLPARLTPYLADGKHAASVTVGNTSALTDALLDGTLDCAFIEGNFDRGLFDAHIFAKARFLPVARAGHPLAGRSITLAALCAYPLILRERGSGTRAVLENYLEQQNLTTDAFARTTEAGSFRLIKRLARDTDMVTFLYENVARDEVQAGALAFLQLEGYELTRPLYFIYPKNNAGSRRYEAFYAALTPDG